MAGDPAGFFSGTQQHVWARGSDDHLHHWWWDVGGSLHSDDWGSALAGNPVAYPSGDEQGVFGRGEGGRLHHWFWSPNSNGVQTEDWGGDLAGDAAGFQYGPQQQVFGCGSDNHLHHWWWDPNGGLQQNDWGGGLDCVVPAAPDDDGGAGSDGMSPLPPPHHLRGCELVPRGAPSGVLWVLALLGLALVVRRTRISLRQEKAAGRR
jgi:hypothetical protein